MPSENKARPLLLLASGVVGVFFGALAMGAFLEKRKYTPVYQDVLFKVNSVEFKDFSILSTTPTFQMEFEVLLWNPNPYEIELLPAAGGKAYMNEPDNELADAVPASTKVPPQKEENQPGIATMIVNITTTKSWLGIGSSLFSVITGFGDVTFYWDYRLTLKAGLPILGGLSTRSLEMPAEAFCGIPADLKSQEFTGAATCGASAEEVAGKTAGRRLLAAPPRRRLEAPPATPPDDATPLYLTDAAAEDAQSSINMTLIGAGVFFFLAGCGLFAFPIIQVLRAQKPREVEPPPPQEEFDMQIDELQAADAVNLRQEEAAYHARSSARPPWASAPPPGRPQDTE